MSVFDVVAAQPAGLQSAASTVASSLTKHRTTSGVHADAATGTTGSPTSSVSSTAKQITSSDFLTLLVNELKNQDPTQPTDPNAYITQLVGVNSLQQLIAINQGVTTLDGPTKAPAATGSISGAPAKQDAQTTQAPAS